MASSLHSRLRLRAGLRGGEACASDGGEACASDGGEACASDGPRTASSLALVVFEMDPGMFCTKVDEPTDPQGWDDNFLCASRDLGLRWSSLGPIAGMVCTRFEEKSDPDGWSDNYLCAPRDYGFRWSNWDPLEGMQCLQIDEPADPHTWNDNFLCWPPLGKGPLNAVSYPKNRTDLINLIRARRDYQSYLEIGQGAREGNFDAIDSKIKIGVDQDRKCERRFPDDTR